MNNNITQIISKLTTIINNLETVYQQQLEFKNKENLSQQFENINCNPIVSTNLSYIPIYIINMKRSTDRLEYINQQIDFYCIKNITRIDGVDGSTLTNKTIGTYNFTNGDIQVLTIITCFWSFLIKFHL